MAGNVRVDLENLSEDEQLGLIAEGLLEKAKAEILDALKQKLKEGAGKDRIGWSRAF